MRLPRPVALVAFAALDVVATRHAWMPPVERVALFALSLAVFSAVAFAAGPVLPVLPVLKGRRALVLVPVALLWILPLRWIPGARLALGVCAAICVAPRRSWWLAGASLGGVVALLQLSANLRFVAFEQAPLAGALLDGVARAWPAPRQIAAPRAPRPDASAEPLPVSGDAHVILITIDALRADRLARMPHLRALAARGLSFTRAYAQVPSTAWSISSLLAGAPPDALAASPPTLAERLRAANWRTEAFYPAGLFFDGRGQLERYARQRFGFAFTDTRTLDAPALTDAVLARLAKLREEGEPRALFFIHYFDVHEPYLAHPGLTEGDSAEARYDGEAAFVDRELGRLLLGLQQLRRPVILCLTADHGEELGDHGGAFHGSSLYDEQVRVPLVILAPGLAARIADEPVELSDVAPTLLALAGTGLPPPALEHDAHAQLGTRRMLVRGRWKLIHDQVRDTDELYDLEQDPGEHRNRFSDERASAAVLHAALDAWFHLVPTDTLERTLADRSAPPVDRAAAARELGEELAFSSRPSLRAALSDGDPALHAEAALALGQMTDRAALPALIALLGVPEARHRAALALGRMRDRRALPALVETLRDVSPERRRLAAHYLGFVGDAGTLPPLEAARTDPRVREEAQRALDQIRLRAAP
jgi:Sulfatase/HEAT repeats